MRDLWCFLQQPKNNLEMKKKTTNHTYFVFIFYFVGGGGKIYHFLRVICILFTKKTLEKSKKLQITRKISFNFLLGGPPEIVRSPAPPSPKNTKKFYVWFAFLTYLMSPLCLSRSLSPWIIFWILTAPTIPWPLLPREEFLRTFPKCRIGSSGSIYLVLWILNSTTTMTLRLIVRW